MLLVFTSRSGGTFSTPGNPAWVALPPQGSLMSHNARRILLVLTILFSLSLPLAPQVQPGLQPDRREQRAESFLARLWERLTAPLAALGIGGPEASDPASPGTVPPPPPPPPPGNDTDGRSILDPLG